MSLVLHVGRWQLWVGVEPRWPFVLHAGRSRMEDWTVGVTIEVY